MSSALLERRHEGTSRSWVRVEREREREREREHCDDAGIETDVTNGVNTGEEVEAGDKQNSANWRWSRQHQEGSTYVFSRD